MDNSENHPQRRLKLVLEYDGTDYSGWQTQPDDRTVQDVLQNAMENFLHQKVTVVAAGRTDSGVHARAQVAHTIVQTDLSCDKIHSALNGLLPNDITVHDVSEAPSDFHARYSARERRYSYTITTRRPALDRFTVWYVKYTLSFDALQKCADLLPGEHDFRAFTRAESDVAHHRCTVFRSEWKTSDHTLIFLIHANRFLHTMVRSLVGTMVEVGRGYFTIDYFKRLLDGALRTDSGPTAPPQGLVLEEIIYE
jgi:tRNA pseudouridine38-40 synthase